MTIGVSTACLYPAQTEDALLQLAELGVRDVEIFFNAQCETRGAIFARIRQICGAYDLRVRAIHPYFTFAESVLLFSNYARRFEDGAALYDELCDVCASLGCPILVLHGEKEPLSLTQEAYIERFGLLAQRVRQAGVCLTQENVVRFRAGAPGTLRAMAQTLGDLFRMTLDVKQAVRCGVDPLALAEEFAPHVAHVHLSDHGAQGDCLPIGSGSFDFETLFSILCRAGFCGNPVVELYRKSYDSIRTLEQSRKIAENFLKKALQKSKRDDTIKSDFTRGEWK